MVESKTQAVNSRLTLFLGLAVMLVAVVVLFGWHTHRVYLLRILPGFVPMQYNTALCFLICAFGLISLNAGRNTFTFISGLIVAAFGTAVLWQYIFHVDLGIDQLLMKAYASSKTTHLGRPSPNTALCFVITGTILSLSALLPEKKRFAWIHYAALFLVSDAVSTLLGYVMQSEALYGWGSVTRMAVHTAVSFIIVGAGFLAAARKKHKTHWRASAVFILGIILSLQVLQILNLSQDVSLRTEFIYSAQDQAKALQRSFQQSLSVLRDFQAFYEGSQTVEREEFTAFADRVLMERQGLQAVEWIEVVPQAEKDNFEKRIQDEVFSEISEELHIKELLPEGGFKPASARETYYPVTFVEPLSTNLIALGFDHGSDIPREVTLETAKKNKSFAATPPLKLFREPRANTPGLLVFNPVFHFEEAVDGRKKQTERLRGFLSVVIRMPEFVDDAFSYLSRADIKVSILDITEKDGQKELYVSPDFPGKLAAASAMGMGHYVREEFEFASRRYEMVFIPGPDYFDGKKNWLPWVAFFLVLAIALAIAVYLEQTIEFNRRIEESSRKIEAGRRHLASIMNAASEVSIISVDTEGKITLFNRGAEKMLGWRAEEVMGKNNPQARFHDPEEMAVRAGELSKKYGRKIEGLDIFTYPVLQGETENREWTYIRRDGSRLLVNLSVTVVYDENGKLSGFLGIAVDVTERKKAEAILEKLSITDPLTGLLNRRGLEQALKREGDFIRRYGTEAYAMLIDLDDFKSINDRFGHAIGDLAIMEVASKIKSMIRSTDYAGRIGGDEFLILLINFDKDKGKTVGERLHRSVADTHIKIGESHIPLPCSAGMVPLVAGVNLEGLIAEAGKGLKRSKAAGKNRLE